MKLFIFHGPGTVSLNSKVLDLKKNFEKASITEVDGKDMSEKELKNLLSQGSLFYEARLIVIDNPPLFDFQNSLSDDVTVILKFSKILPSNSVILREAQKKGAQILSFSEEKDISVFPFLDALVAKDPKAFSLFEPLLKEYGGQYLLTMIAFSLRRLINPPKSLPPFVLKKIQDQRKNFPQESLKNLYKAVLESDLKIKTGVLEEETAMKLLSHRFLD